MNKRKKASYGMKKMSGGDYMEPSTEIKFGAPRDKAKNGRVRATKGTEIMENAKNYGKNPSYGNSPAAKARKAKVAEQRASRATSQGSSSNVKSKVDSKGNQIIGTDADIKKAESIKAKSNPYSKAKKADANLDSYIAKRKGLTKGTPEYNAVQNKINKAYGKGPTNRPTSKPTTKPTTTPSGGGSKGNRFYPGEDLSSPGPTKKLERKEAAPIDSGAREFKLKTNRPFTPTPKSDKETKIEARTAKKVGKIQDRRAKATVRKEDRADAKSNRSADKMFKKNEREGAKADRKQGRMDNRADRQDAKASRQSSGQMNKEAKQIKRDNIKATRAQGRAEKAAARKMLKGGMKYEAGGAKPDSPDLDNDGNTTESMKSALKDRRSSARKGKMKGEKKKPGRNVG